MNRAQPLCHSHGTCPRENGEWESSNLSLRATAGSAAIPVYNMYKLNLQIPKKYFKIFSQKRWTFRIYYDI